jgi:hypothetical protein
MKKSDLMVILATAAFLLPFFVFSPVLGGYKSFNANHAYLASFLKFALLATFGECIGLRIRKGHYWEPGFGLVPRALVWGFLGVCIKMAFVIFGEGAPYMLKTFGVSFPVSYPGDILREAGFSWIKLAGAASVGVMMNLFFAPVFMTFHKITDIHIVKTRGTLRGFFTPIPFARYFSEIDWNTMWGFVYKKTIPLFWIPAQTLNFMLPEEWRILFAAFLGVVLGVLLSVASLRGKQASGIRQ